MRQKAYCNLFRGLAERHKLIQHSPAVPRFARIVVSLDPIQRLIDLQEFTQLLGVRLKASANKYALVLETTNTQYRDNGGDNYQRNRHGAFLLLTPCGTDPDAISDALDECEVIGEEIMAGAVEALKEDFKTRFQVASITNDCIGPLGNGGWYGVRFDFEFTSPATSALSYNPAAFN